MELILNMDIVIPEGTPKDKYAKYGMDYPVIPGHTYKLIRGGEMMSVPENMVQKERVFVFPGDTLMNLTTDESFLFVFTRLVKEV